MVVIKRPIGSILELGYQNKGKELIYAAQQNGKPLNGSTMNSLNGILHQLSTLSIVANELFQSVLDSSKETFTRITDISTRLKNVNEKLDTIESYAVQSSYTFYGNSSLVLKEETINILRKKK